MTENHDSTLAANPLRPGILAWTTYESPLGPLTLLGGPGELAGVRFPGRVPPLDEAGREPERFAAATAQLDAYFAGERQAFDLPLDLGGTPFQRSVWAALTEIPYGTTTTYGRLTDRLGRDGRDHEQVRRVAAAIGRTPAPIVVPCHRVLATGGGLTGYLGGLQRKRALLDLEARVATGRPPEPAWAFRQTALI